MAALGWLPESDVLSDFPRAGQAGCRDKRVIAGIQNQGGYSNLLQMRLGRGATPVIFRITKSVQGRGKYIVKVIKIARRAQGVLIKKPRELAQLSQGLGLHTS